MINCEYDEDEQEEVKRKHYTLRFNYTFEYDNDIVFFSHFYPYTHRKLQNMLSDVMAKPKVNTIARLDTLCNTLAGNQCYVMTVTSNIKTYLTTEDE
jgi:hypothetical protein